jgi:dihydroorotate dehydrogenase
MPILSSPIIVGTVDFCGMTLASLIFPLIKPIFNRIDAETAHRWTIAMLKSQANARQPAPSNLAIDCWGLSFPNPLGVAAGFDKNADVPDALLGLGFGFVEVGTVTPRPQAGNPRPRLFRLAEDEAVINRMGFNNLGSGIVRRHLEARRDKRGMVGVSIGANKNSADWISDYVQGVRTFADMASYLAINISSPNTTGLRGLQSRAALEDLIAAVKEARASRPTPLLVKIAPDLSDREIEDIAELCSADPIDGIIVSNTTVSRPPLRSPLARERGGLSGKPLFDMSTRALARLRLLVDRRVVLVGTGGISDAATAWAKIAAGATLIQLYTALVYRGPALIDEILDGLASRLAEGGFASIAQASGCRAREIAHHGSAGT